MMGYLTWLTVKHIDLMILDLIGLLFMTGFKTQYHCWGPTWHSESSDCTVFQLEPEEDDDLRTLDHSVQERDGHHQVMKLSLLNLPAR